MLLTDQALGLDKRISLKRVAPMAASCENGALYSCSHFTNIKPLCNRPGRRNGFFFFFFLGGGGGYLNVIFVLKDSFCTDIFPNTS